jgi:hypothetical protein
MIDNGFALTVLYLEMQFYQAVCEVVGRLQNVQVEVVCENGVGEYDVRVGHTGQRFEFAACPNIASFRAAAVVALTNSFIN